MVDTPTIWKDQHRANLTLTGDQSTASATDFGMGRYLVVWQEAANGVIAPGNGADIVGQIFDASGNPFGAEFQVNQTFANGDQSLPQAAGRPGGGSIAVYLDGSGSGNAVRVETYGTDGKPVPGTPKTIAANQFVTQGMSQFGALLSDPTIAVRPDGAYLVAYFRGTIIPTFDVVAHVVTAAGVVGPPLVLAGGAADPDAAVLSNGNYVVVFSQGDDPAFRILTPAGANLTGGKIDVDPDPQFSVEVAALKGGGFVAVWSEANGDGNGSGIRARLYDNNGNAKGLAFTVNTTTAGNQTTPDVAALADGGFVVVWDDNGPLDRIAGQRFNDKGGKVGAEFLAGGLGNEVSPSVAVLGDGRFIVTFEAASNKDIYATIFDPRGKLITGTSGHDVLTSRLDGAEIKGLAGNDILLGMTGPDLLRGGKGDDILAGGPGKNKLWGNGGKDAFLFDIEPGGGGLSRIQDFKPKKDKLWLDQEIFASIGPKLDKKEFKVGKKAGDGNDYVVHNRNTGVISYDEDGKGGVKQVKFAKVEKGLKLAHKDFVMVEDLAF